ncbi:MAG TPA: ABC transporter permease [Candidatus Acidoferrales bacterium]|nr:ABC transporter permease [Candidatus Acidoferrales bacterium]
MPFRLEPRAVSSRTMTYASPLIAVALTMLTGYVIFCPLGKDPAAAFSSFFIAPLDNRYGLGELLLKASPLMLIATGLSIGFRANIWNIGAEGQLALGAIAASGIALYVHPPTAWLVLPTMIVAGALGGMAWAAIPAFLRTRFNANEILVSLMLTYVGLLLLSYLVHGPWRDPAGLNFPQSQEFDGDALFPIIWPGTRLNASIFIALAAVAAGWVFMKKSFLGYQLRVAGLAGGAARYAGFDATRLVWVGLLAGGAAAGLAGVGEVAGPIGQLLPSVSPGYGFAAIIVAFVGRLQPLGIVLASLLMSLLYLGGEQAQIALNLPSAITGVFEGVLLFYLLGCDVFINYRLRWRPRTPAQAARTAVVSVAEVRTP